MQSTADPDANMPLEVVHSLKLSHVERKGLPNELPHVCSLQQEKTSLQRLQLFKSCSSFEESSFYGETKSSTVDLPVGMQEGTATERYIEDEGSNLVGVKGSIQVGQQWSIVKLKNATITGKNFAVPDLDQFEDVFSTSIDFIIPHAFNVQS
ncbi:hypothetical protein Acr_24g0004320 [Actinidia rufa]|uniref:Uncharacterized protein n=1 Tax=Actinidia rufa TaxID=165716 RepID=A0A7J0GTX6_9ERIC|nr:hypothetical protein Acr_24g0004320 [Actinidia rufa]